MSRIGDNSDESRIREMQEADQRMKVDREKRSEDERIVKSFQEVMTQRTGRETARRTAAQTQAEGDAQAALSKRNDPNAADKKKPIVLGNPRSQELQKRAALATQQQSQLHTARSKLADSARALESERNVDLVRKNDDELDSLKRDVDRDVAREQRIDEQHDLRNNPLAIGLDVDEDGRNQQQRSRDGGGKGDEENKPAAVAAAKADAPRGAQPTKLPTEILEHIAKSVAVAAAADGKVSMSVSLKGTMLDGVTLHVTANKGKVRCVFENCDKQLGNLIEASKGELMRQLGKRGLELDILRVK